jgi:hypothetical protein
MFRLFRRLFELPFHLILIGVALGMAGRAIYPPKEEATGPRTFPDPIVQPEEFTDLEII